MIFRGCKIITSGWLLAVLFYFLPYNVLAFEISRFSDVPIKNDIVLSPTRVEFSLDPGTQVSRYLTIVNRTGQDVLFNIDVEDFSPSEDSSDGVILNKTVNGLDSSLRRYISTDISQFTLAHGEQARVLMTVNLPKGVTPGGKYSAVLVSSSPVKNEVGAAKVITRLGSLFFVKVNGSVRQSGSLKDVSFYDNKIKILYDNDGDIYLNPYGIISIYDESKELVDTINVEPWFVLPRSVRSRVVEIGSLDAGRYTANIAVNRGYDNIIDSKELSFEIESSARKSLWFYGGLFFVGLLIVLFYKYISRLFKNRQKDVIQ